MVVIDPDQVSQIIANVAEQVILPRFRHLEDEDVREKNPGDLVTIADTEAEQALAGQLRALLPGSLVVGEEGVAADPALLDALRDSAPVWVIDPIDGTSNFVKGNVNFAVIVALVQNGETRQGWIHDPLLHRTSHAVRGQGTWCGNRRLRIDQADGGAMQGSLIGSAAWRDRQRLRRAGHILRQMGSAAHEYLSLLDGSLDYSCYHRLHPWDHAAGVLLHGEAGGHSALLDGGNYRPLPQAGTLLLARDPASWSDLRDMFLE